MKRLDRSDKLAYSTLPHTVKSQKLESKEKDGYFSNTMEDNLANSRTTQSDNLDIFSTMPIDIHYNISTYLSVKDLSILPTVSKKCKVIFMDNNIVELRLIIPYKEEYYKNQFPTLRLFTTISKEQKALFTHLYTMSETSLDTSALGNKYIISLKIPAIYHLKTMLGISTQIACDSLLEYLKSKPSTDPKLTISRLIEDIKNDNTALKMLVLSKDGSNIFDDLVIDLNQPHIYEWLVIDQLEEYTNLTAYTHIEVFDGKKVNELTDLELLVSAIKQILNPDSPNLDIKNLDLRFVDISDGKLNDIIKSEDAIQLINANLMGGRFIKTDFSNLQITQSNCICANFTEISANNSRWDNVKCNLSKFIKANFSQAKIINCDLTCANFTEADFTEAELNNSICRFAKFINANFTYAYLDGADLTGGDLTGADLTGSVLCGTIFTKAKFGNILSVDLSESFVPAFEEYGISAYCKLTMQQGDSPNWFDAINSIDDTYKELKINLMEQVVADLLAEDTETIINDSEKYQLVKESLANAVAQNPIYKNSQNLNSFISSTQMECNAIYDMEVEYNDSTTIKEDI